MIGYLNYRLLEVFQQLVNKAEIDREINEYEDAVESFLQLTDLGTLAKVFKDHPKVAPVTLAGLPQFTVHLNTDWEGRSLYTWEEILDKQCNWPHASHIHITTIARNCIIIQYSVLPFFAPAVFRDLTDPLVLALLKVHGVIMVEPLSDQLLAIGRNNEEDTQCRPVPEEHLQSLLSHQAPIESASQLLQSEDSHNIQTTLLNSSYTNELEELSPSPPDTTSTISSEKRFASTRKNTCTQEEKNLLLLKATRAWSSKDQPIEDVQSLISDGADVNTQDNYYRSTPLHYAAKYGEMQMVELLVKSGADIHKENKYGNTPLHYAAQSHKEVVELLVKSGADIHKENKHRCTPLHYAAKYGEIQMVEMLVKFGADIHKENKDGNTPLHYAAKNGKTEMVELLVKFGADVHKANKNGETALLGFVTDLDPYFVDPGTATDMIHCLVHHGAEINCRNKFEGPNLN